MNIDIQILYILILLFSSLVLICMILMSLYISTLSKYTKAKIDLSKEKPNNIILNSKIVSEKIDQKLSIITDQIVSKWIENADGILSQNIKNLDNVLKDKIENIYKKENDSLELYKNTKFKEFDSMLLEFIKKISKDIIKSEIDINRHKKLIMDGLERAKSDGLFK